MDRDRRESRFTSSQDRILKVYAERNKILTDEAKKRLKNSCDAILDLMGYRDLIIHSLPFDVEQGIASSIGKGARVTQVLITSEALEGVQTRIQLLLTEIPEIDLLLRLGDYEGSE